MVKNNLETLEFHIEPIQDLLFEEVQVGKWEVRVEKENPAPF